MKTVNKVVDLIEVFMANESDLSVSELSKITGLNMSTTNRIAKTLVERNYLKQAGKRGKYSLGMKLFSYISPLKLRMAFRQTAKPFLIQLCRESNETVDLLTLEDMHCVSIEVITTNSILRAVPIEGSTYELHISAAGKAILATFADRELEKYLDNTVLKQRTPNTITDIDELKKQLRLARQNEVAFDYEEYILNVHSVAASIKGANGNTLGAVSVVGPKSRLNQTRLAELTPLVKECALRISRELGYQRE